VLDHQGQGLGAGLLKDAIGRTLAATGIAGIRILAVYTKHKRARSFYGHFGFRPSPSDPLHLLVLLKDLKIGVKGDEGGAKKPHLHLR